MLDDAVEPSWQSCSEHCSLRMVSTQVSCESRGVLVDEGERGDEQAVGLPHELASRMALTPVRAGSDSTAERSWDLNASPRPRALCCDPPVSRSSASRANPRAPRRNNSGNEKSAASGCEAAARLQRMGMRDADPPFEKPARKGAGHGRPRTKSYSPWCDTTCTKQVHTQLGMNAAASARGQAGVGDGQQRCGLETEGRRRRGRRAARLRRVRPRAASALLRARQPAPSFGLAETVS